MVPDVSGHLSDSLFCLFFFFFISLSFSFFSDMTGFKRLIRRLIYPIIYYLAHATSLTGCCDSAPLRFLV